MKSKLFLFCLFGIVFFNANAQKNSWTPYFPVRDSVIGHVFIGNSPMDAKVAELLPNVTVRTYNSATSFTKDQQRSVELTWNSFFSRTGARVAHIEAHNVKLDQITTSSLDEVPGGVPFVFAGLRADSCTVTFRKSNKTTVDLGSMISSIKEVYPAISATEIGALTELLKIKYTQKDSSDVSITLKQPGVYFMVQVAEYEVFGKSGMINWKKAGSSFTDIDTKRFADSLILNQHGRPYRTGSTKTRFSSWSDGDQADVWLEVDTAGNLLAKYKTGKMKAPGSKLLAEDRGAWIYDNTLIHRYPYGSDANSEKFKDISLTIRATRQNDKIIITSGAKSGKGSNVLGSTFIFYPEVRFKWKSFSL